MKNIKKEFDEKEPIFTIGTFAKKLGINQRTLRIYDNENLLKPQRTISNRRMYSLADYNIAELTLFLTRNLAMNLSGVKIIFSCFEKFNVESKDYLKTIKEIADKAKINNVVQKTNILKTSKRGRKKQN